MAQTDDEIVYRGTAPGLHFYYGVALRPRNAETTWVEMSTVVHYEGTRGQVYFFFVRPGLAFAGC